ncbi:MAG TPA: hypothetical protein VJX47_00520 [Candidatus Sulfotelmatobacter sp.]|nr:hypothetical protein [Candidatus Sulfotelmatobacter sp.]
MNQADLSIANAILGIDTLWGGDVMCPSGTGRFIADCWFSDEPLPATYTHSTAARLRTAGGVTGKDSVAVEDYLREMSAEIIRSMDAINVEARRVGGLRGIFLEGLNICLTTMWELALETAGKGNRVAYEKSVRASTGRAPEPSQPEAKRERVAELLARGGYPTSGSAGVLNAVDAWRRDRIVPMASVRALSAAVIAQMNELCEKNLAPHLPHELARVPRANIDFLPIKEAWFSGSMNYIGRARNADGSPKYEATYEINASLQMSFPEFEQLVSHEVVPGHVTTFAYLQDLYVRGLVGFEATVLTMNTRAATLFEGIANNAILIAHGVTEVDQLPDEDLQIGVLLALLQDDAKNEASYLTWGEKMQKEEVAKVLRRDYLVSDERADKLSGAWGRHPLLGRMYLPAYRCGTEKVGELRRKYQPSQLLPVLYGAAGLVDSETVETACAQPAYSGQPVG